MASTIPPGLRDPFRSGGGAGEEEGEDGEVSGDMLNPPAPRSKPFLTAASFQLARGRAADLIKGGTFCTSKLQNLDVPAPVLVLGPV